MTGIESDATYSRPSASDTSRRAGTGSFVKALDGFGLPGAFSKETSKQAVSLSHAGPLYVVKSEGESDRESLGPDAEDNGIRVIDREQEEMQRFVNEMDRLSKVTRQPVDEGEISFDFFNKLGKSSNSLLPESFDNVMVQLVPLLKNPKYRVDVIVWATTPSRTAWTRAT